MEHYNLINEQQLVKYATTTLMAIQQTTYIILLLCKGAIVESVLSLNKEEKDYAHVRPHLTPFFFLFNHTSHRRYRRACPENLSTNPPFSSSFFMERAGAVGVAPRLLSPGGRRADNGARCREKLTREKRLDRRARLTAAE